MNFIIFIATLFISVVIAEDKWVWSSDRDNDGVESRQDDVASRIRVPVYDRYEDRRQSRYDVREPTTERPKQTKPEQEDFYNNEFGETDDPRYYNQNPQKFGPGSRPYPSGNPANGVLVGPSGPSGIIGRPPGGFNTPKNHPANGILVGPGGPTGVIGRPPYIPGSYGGIRPIPGQGGYPGAGQYPNVGPGGYPSGPGGFANGPGGYPSGPGGFPNGPGGYPSGPGGFPNGPAQFPNGPGGVYPGNGYPGRPGGFGGGYPGGFNGQGPYGGAGPFSYEGGNYGNYGPEYDQYDGKSLGRKAGKDSTKGSDKNILKKSISDKN